MGVASGGSDRGWGWQGIRLRRSEGATTLPILNCFAIKGVGVAVGGAGRGWQWQGVGYQGVGLRIEGATTLPLLNCLAIKEVGMAGVGVAEGGSGVAGSWVAWWFSHSGSWWFVVVQSWWFCGGLWWFVVVQSWWFSCGGFVVVCGGFVVVSGGSWWFSHGGFVVVCDVSLSWFCGGLSWFVMCYSLKFSRKRLCDALFSQSGSQIHYQISFLMRLATCPFPFKEHTSKELC